MRMPKEDMAKNSVVDVHGVRHFKNVIAKASNDRASSSWDIRDRALWQGHEVKSEFGPPGSHHARISRNLCPGNLKKE